MARCWKLLRSILTEFSEDECPMQAAALAYYAMFSIPPLVLIIITVTGMVWGKEAVQNQIQAQMTEIVGETGTEQILDMVRHSERSEKTWLATLISFGVLFLGSTGLMLQLQAALNRVWDTSPQRGGVKHLLIKRGLSFAMVLAVAFLMLVSLILSTVLTSMLNSLNGVVPGEAKGTLMMLMHLSVNLVVITLLLAALFKWVPDAVIRWSDVWVGAVVTTVLFLLGKELLALYLGSKDPSTYGTAGALVLLLSWIYYTMMILLFGAEFTQVWAKSRGHAIRPEGRRANDSP